MEGHLLGGVWHTWRVTHVAFACILLGLLSIIGDSSWRGHMWKVFLSIFGDCLGGRTSGDYYILCWDLTMLALCKFVRMIKQTTKVTYKPTLELSTSLLSSEMALSCHLVFNK
jgi:hypothetical protein